MFGFLRKARPFVGPAFSLLCLTGAGNALAWDTLSCSGEPAGYEQLSPVGFNTSPETFLRVDHRFTSLEQGLIDYSLRAVGLVLAHQAEAVVSCAMADADYGWLGNDAARLRELAAVNYGSLPHDVFVGYIGDETAYGRACSGRPGFGYSIALNPDQLGYINDVNAVVNYGGLMTHELMHNLGYKHDQPGKSFVYAVHHCMWDFIRKLF